MTTMNLQEIERLAEQLPAQQQLELIRHLTVRIAGTIETKDTTSLYGAWKGCIPEDFDLEAALREIRGESEAKLAEIQP